jgi:hypothetical protein
VISVDLAELRAATGLASGFVNVVTGLGWLVQNLPVSPRFPYPDLSTRFMLGTASGIDVTALDALVEYASEPRTSPPTGAFVGFPVGDVESNAEGVGGPVTSPPDPPLPGAITFAPVGRTDECGQPDHLNVQAAVNQCVPAAEANLLDWLRTTYGLPVPDPHVPGVGVDTDGNRTADQPDAAGSLVSHLDATMGRVVGRPGERDHGDRHEPARRGRGGRRADHGAAVTLFPRPGNTATSGEFRTAPGARPVVSLKARAKGRGIFDFRIEAGLASAAPPRLCTGTPPATILRATFVVDDGTNPRVAYTTRQAWRCLERGGRVEYLRAP